MAVASPYAVAKLRDYVDAVGRASSAIELRDSIELAAAEFGVRHFSIVRHVNRLYSLTEEIGLTTFPAAWVEMVRERDTFADDPVIVASQQSVVGFSWSRLPEMISLTNRQVEHLTLARTYGLGGGFTVPIHLPGELSASCSFAAADHDALGEDFHAAAQWIAAVAYEALRRLVSARARKPALPLSSRQIECVFWLCRGKSKAATAQILGISEDTVRFHIKAIKDKWDVSSGVQVAARALHEGIVTYHDIV